ncbi:MAG: methylenetetrahydrofolate reductase [Candidatus Hydrogenedentes bacterium]|nr:methylenetetrahydrofolate reductase [Candidatus Hydrogenedentota bacterium]
MTNNSANLKARIQSGQSILMVELTPPQTGDPAPLRAAAKQFSGKVHAIGVSDSRHGVCVSSLAAAAILAGEGIEPVMHLVTRDRNRLALLGACLGAQALGIRNILCTSGDHQTLGACPPAKNVFDIDSIQLLSAAARLESGAFCLGAVAAPFADPPEMQLMRLAKKISAGAEFLITQPVFDLERFKAWWDQVAQRGFHQRAAFIAGIEPLLDAEQARKLAESRPRPMIPQAVLDRVASASDKAAQRAAGIEVAVETIRQLSSLEGLRGFQIVADDPAAALEIIQRAGLEAV